MRAGQLHPVQAGLPDPGGVDLNTAGADTGVEPVRQLLGPVGFHQGERGEHGIVKGVRRWGAP